MDLRPARPSGFTATRLGIPAAPGVHPPSPRHARGDFAAQERFKADFRTRMEELAREEPDRSVQVWAFDEHRAGLKPVIRRVWARRGQRPLALGHHRFPWLYVFGFVRPATGAV